MNVATLPVRPVVRWTVVLMLALGPVEGGPAVSALRAEASPPTAFRYVLRLPVREGSEDDARALATRLINYLKANYPDLGEYRGFANWSPHFQRQTVIYSLPDTRSAERLFTRLANEEGWRALKSEMEGAFEMEASEWWFMIPVALPETPRDGGGFLWFRTAEVLPEQLAGALLLAREEAKYVNEKYPQAQIQVYGGIREHVGKVFWFGAFESSDAWRDVQAGLWSDTTYLELMERAGGRFVAGSWRESLEMLRQS